MLQTNRRYMTRRRFILTVGAIASTSLLAACGDDSEDESAGQQDETTPAEATTTPAAEATDPSPTATQPSPTATATPEPEGPTLGPDGHFETVQVSDDGTRHLIPLRKIQSGGPPKDGIPSIDSPQFVGSDDWDEQRFDDDQFVLGVEVNGERRAYPFQIMVWHELVNDEIAGVPILASYCPLCGSAIAFVREIETDSGREAVEFGVSGKLYNSDLLMYDRKTDSYWSQLTGTAVVGELTGQRLDFYPSELMTWGDWKNTYPDSVVLTRSTGFNRDYDNPPYAGYDESPGIWFPVTATDDRLHEKTRVTGVELSLTNFAAYPDDLVAEHGPVNDEVRGVPLLVFANPAAGDNVVVFLREVDGQTLQFSMDDEGLVDEETGSRWTYDGLAVSGELEGAQLEQVDTIKGFWFAWYAFHQQTALWLPDEASR
ncbi:DUF3179 domain-containing protein [soil metagenome]